MLNFSKRFLILIITLFLFTDFSVSKRKIEPCDVYGIVFFEKDKYRSDVRVFVEEEEIVADLLIFKEDNRLFADNEGLWYITENPALADVKVYLEKDKRYSDFSIAYIEERTFAGCQF